MNRAVHEEFLSATMPALDLVYNLARRMVRDPLVVEDLVQETYVRAFEAWVSRRKPRKVEPWIATICLNFGRSYWRRAAAHREVLTGDPVTVVDPIDVERAALQEVERAIVHDALWELPEEQRITVALMDLNGLTAAEIAKVTHVPRGTVLFAGSQGAQALGAGLGEQGGAT